jgi:hypothetical protein
LGLQGMRLSSWIMNPHLGRTPCQAPDCCWKPISFPAHSLLLCLFIWLKCSSDHVILPPPPEVFSGSLLPAG